jgi:hypothetical protein
MSSNRYHSIYEQYMGNLEQSLAHKAYAQRLEMRLATLAHQGRCVAYWFPSIQGVLTFFSYYYEDLKGTLVVGTTKRETEGAPTYAVLSILQGRDDASLSVLDVV